MPAKKKRRVDTWKTKKWYTIVAPKSFNEKELGETPSADPEKLVGRTIKASLADLTEKRSQRHINIFFAIDKIKGQQANTVITGHEMQRGYVGRQAKRMKSLVNTIFEVKTKDKKKAELQVMCLARARMNEKQEKAVRKEIEEEITAKAKKENFEKLFQEVVFGKLSAEVFANTKKIFPVTRMEITKSKIKSEN